MQRKNIPQRNIENKFTYQRKKEGDTLHNLTQKLIDKHASRDPLMIAKDLNIIILFENLGSIKGYYNTAFRQKFIHINENLSPQLQKFTAAHELGHALLHPKANTPFLRSSTFLSVDKLEMEANKFAITLLISDEDLQSFGSYTVDQLSQLYGYPRELIELRLN